MNDEKITLKSLGEHPRQKFAVMHFGAFHPLLFVMYIAGTSILGIPFLPVNRTSQMQHFAALNPKSIVPKGNPAREGFVDSW